MSTSNPVALQPQPTAPSSMIDTRQRIAALVDRRNAIVTAMKTVMVEGIDYGTVPGTPKPSLYKPGSEKILSMFNLAVKPTVEDLSTPDTIRYRVHTAISNYSTGEVLGVGIGEASSAESKYQWRAVVCQEEWDDTPEDRRRTKWKKGDRGAYAVRQVRADFEDIANTVLKMAKKRSQIDATLTVTAASDVFSQDVKDLKDAGFDLEADDQPPVPAAVPEQHELEKKPTAPPAQGAATITAEQAKRFWAVAIKRTDDYKAIMEYLKAVQGVHSKDLLLASRYEEAMKWAETGKIDE